MRPFSEPERYWSLDQLAAYPLFTPFEPAFPFDPQGPDIAAGRRVLKFTTITQMAQEADRMCRLYEGKRPPSQVALFLFQFPNRDYDDCLYAHWALHADKTIGPGCCAAAIWIEPLEFPEDGEEIQKWATWHLVQHPWDGPARGIAEALHRSAKVIWVSQDARDMLTVYIAKNHEHADLFFAQPKLNRHPLPA